MELVYALVGGALVLTGLVAGSFVTVVQSKFTKEKEALKQEPRH